MNCIILPRLIRELAGNVLRRIVLSVIKFRSGHCLIVPVTHPVFVLIAREDTQSFWNLKTVMAPCTKTPSSSWKNWYESRFSLTQGRDWEFQGFFSQQLEHCVKQSLKRSQGKSRLRRDSGMLHGLWTKLLLLLSGDVYKRSKEEWKIVKALLNI